MVTYICPICHNGVLRFQVKDGYGIDFDLQKSNQKITCRNCKRKISYSVQKNSSNNPHELSIAKL